MSNPRFEPAFFKKEMAELTKKVGQELADLLAEMPPNQDRRREEQWRQATKLKELQEALQEAFRNFVQ